MEQHAPAVNKAAAGDEPLPRHLSLISLLFLMLNGIVGAGIFGLPQDVHRLAGDAGFWLFPLCGVLILPVVLVFVHLGSRYSGTGGPMLYVASSFGPFAGFQTGWAFYVARLSAFAANINLLVTTLGAFWTGFTETIPRLVTLLAVTVLLVLLNIRSPRTAMSSLSMLTFAKFIPLLGLAGAGLFTLAGSSEPAAISAPVPVQDLGAAILLVVYAYVGFESGLVPAAEAASPRRDIPRALILAMFSAAVLYTALYIVCVNLLPDLSTTAQPVVALGGQLFGAVGGVVITLGVAAAVLGNLMGAAFSTPRVTYRLAIDGFLPAQLGKVNPGSGMPSQSVVLFGVFGFLLAASGSFVWLATISVIVRVLIYLACIAAMNRSAHMDGIRMPGGWLISAFAVLFCTYLLTQASLASWITSGVLLLAGSVLFAVTRIARRS